MGVLIIKHSSHLHYVIRGFCNTSTKEVDPSLSVRMQAAADVGEDWYTVLGVSRDASYREIKNAYRDLVRRTHPDKQLYQQQNSVGGCCSDESIFVRIQQAWEVLSDSTTRRAFDEQLAAADRVGIAAEEVSHVEFIPTVGYERLLARRCRCGGCYEITVEERADGFNTVPCSDCSLYVTIID